jgi:hypothetical protein
VQPLDEALPCGLGHVFGPGRAVLRDHAGDILLVALLSRRLPNPTEG